MAMAAVAPPSPFGSAFRIDANTRIAGRGGVRAPVRIGTHALIRHRRRCVSAVRADAGALEGDDVVAVEKAEKQRKTDGEHDVFSLRRFIRPYRLDCARRCALLTRTARAGSVPFFVPTRMSGFCEPA